MTLKVVLMKSPQTLPMTLQNLRRSMTLVIQLLPQRKQLFQRKMAKTLLAMELLASITEMSLFQQRHFTLLFKRLAKMLHQNLQRFMTRNLEQIKTKKHLLISAREQKTLLDLIQILLKHLRELLIVLLKKFQQQRFQISIKKRWTQFHFQLHQMVLVKPRWLSLWKLKTTHHFCLRTMILICQLVITR